MRSNLFIFFIGLLIILSVKTVDANEYKNIFFRLAVGSATFSVPALNIDEEMSLNEINAGFLYNAPEFAVGISISSMGRQTVIDTQIGSIDYKMESEGTGYGISAFYKLKIADRLFVGPGITMSSTNITIYEKSNTLGITTSDSETDTDLTPFVILDYELNNKSDLFISYTVDDDFNESDDHDFHDISLTLLYTLKSDFSVNASYQFATNDSETVKNSKAYSLGIGKTF